MTSEPDHSNPTVSSPGRRLGFSRAGFIVFLTGILVTLLAFFSIRSSDRRDRLAEFDRLATERSGAIGKSLVTFENTLQVTRAFYSASEEVLPNEFAVFSEELLGQRPAMLALEWIPSMDLPENDPALGFALASNPTCLEAMRRSRDSGTAVSTAPISVLADGEETPGFCIFMPIYDHDRVRPTVEERQEHLEGFVLTSVDSKRLVASALESFAPEGIDVRFADVSDPEVEGVLCSWDSVERRFRDPATTDMHSGAGDGHVHETVFEVAGRRWLVACTPTPAFLAGSGSPLPWVVLFGGSVFSLLGLLYVLRHRRESMRIRESETRYRMMIDSTPDAIVILDPDAGRFVDANGRACKIFGATREELLKLGPIELSPPRQPDGSPSADSALEKIRSALADGPPAAFEWLHRDLEGNEFPCEVRLAPFPSHKGNLVLGSVTDISGRLQEAEERRLLERKLLQAQKLESLGLLTSGIAHDFNNLLTPIMGRAGLALDDLPPEHPIREHLDHIQVSALRAEELIRQLLAYTGQASFKAVKLCLSSAAQEMARLWEVSLGEGVRLDLELADPGPVIEGDAGQIRQVILNLITNAGDAMGSTGGTVRVATGVTDADAEFLAGFMGATGSNAGRYAWCEVSDTGPGMDEETQNRVFDPFFTTKQEGRGLGLATVLGIVKTHRGGVAVTSKPHEGTRVKVVFPLVAGPADTVTEHADVPTRGAAEGLILVVDDEMRIRHLITTILERQGFETVEAHDGPSALTAFEQHRGRVRLVLVDYTMPGMSGVEVFSRLQELDRDVPVILMSGYGERTMLTRVSEQGLAGFLQKPFDPKQLLEAVHKVLELV